VILHYREETDVSVWLRALPVGEVGEDAGAGGVGEPGEPCPVGTGLAATPGGAQRRCPATRSV
jgi:hypothetical protein